MENTNNTNNTKMMLVMVRQLKEAGEEQRAELAFHKAIINRELPYTVGGGIGQSRLCMYFLRKAHIGEVQTSVWPEDMEVREYLKGHSVELFTVLG